MSQTIAIDLYSVVPDLHKVGSKLEGWPVKGLVPWVQAAQAKGHSVFFVAGNAHDAYMRQLIERLLEGFGLRAVFVTHGMPYGFDAFISTRAVVFNGQFPDLA